MRRSINSLLGLTIGATDGEIGKVEEFYFDDHAWTVRYLIVKTGGWLTERKVLISPEALEQPDWDHKTLPVNLTREQIKNSPDINTDKPISRQEEDLLYAYYPWQNYYDAGLYGGTIGMMDTFPGQPAGEGANIKDSDDIEDKGPDSHLRSTHDVKGYTIHATDGSIGDVSDFIVDDQAWKINFLVVDTGNWFPGKKILLSPAWIKDVNWSMQEVVVNVTKEAVKNSPEYDKSRLFDTGYSDELHEHYGHPKTDE